MKDRQQILIPNHLVKNIFLSYYLPFIKITCDAPTAVTVLSTAPKLPGSRILSQITVIGNVFFRALWSIVGVSKIPKYLKISLYNSN